MTSRIQSYINQINQLYDGNPWLDETFFKKLDTICDNLVFTPSPGGNHSVAKVVSHVIEWRKEIVRRLLENSSERKLTEESPNNWKPNDQLRQAGWQQLYKEFKESQQTLVDALEGKEDTFLDELLSDSEFNKEYFVAGILHHDLYHLGQIGLILKLCR